MSRTEQIKSPSFICLLTENIRDNDPRNVASQDGEERTQTANQQAELEEEEEEGDTLNVELLL